MQSLLITNYAMAGNVRLLESNIPCFYAIQNITNIQKSHLIIMIEYCNSGAFYSIQKCVRVKYQTIQNNVNDEIAWNKILSTSKCALK